MNKNARWKRVISTLLAVSMLGQSCSVAIAEGEPGTEVAAVSESAAEAQRQSEAEAKAAKAAAEEAARKQSEAESEAARIAAEEAARKQSEAESEAARIAAEEEAARKQSEAESEAARIAAEEEAARKQSEAESEAARIAAEEEAARKQSEAESEAARIAAEEEAARKQSEAESEAARIAAEEEAARKQSEAESEAARIAAEEEAARKQSEAESEAAAQQSETQQPSELQTETQPTELSTEGQTQTETESEPEAVITEVKATVGETAWLMGENGTGHEWVSANEQIVKVVAGSDVVAEIQGVAEGDAFVAHSYMDGDDYMMETFHVTVVSAESETETETETETEKEAADLDSRVTQKVFLDADGALAVQYTVEVTNQTAGTDAEEIAVKAVFGKESSYYRREGETPALHYVEDIANLPAGLDLEELRNCTAEQLALYTSAAIWEDQTIAGGEKKEFVFYAHVGEEAASYADLPSLWYVDGEQISADRIKWQDAELIQPAETETESETEAQTEAEPLIYTYSDDKAVICVEFPAGTELPADTILTAAQTTGESRVRAEITVALEESGLQITAADGYTLELTSAQGELPSEDLNGLVTITYHTPVLAPAAEDVSGIEAEEPAQESSVRAYLGAAEAAAELTMAEDGAVAAAVYEMAGLEEFTLVRAETAEEQPQIYTYEDEQTVITVEVPEGVRFPEGTVLEVTPIAEGSQEFLESAEKVEAANADKNFAEHVFYDICFKADGEEVEPEGGEVFVHIRFKEAALQIEAAPEEIAEDEVVVSHILDDSTIEDVTQEVVTDENGAVESLGFTTDSFTIYGASRAMVLEGEFSGTTYQATVRVDGATITAEMPSWVYNDLYNAWSEPKYRILLTAAPYEQSKWMIETMDPAQKEAELEAADSYKLEVYREPVNGGDRTLCAVNGGLAVTVVYDEEKDFSIGENRKTTLFAGSGKKGDEKIASGQQVSFKDKEGNNVAEGSALVKSVSLQSSGFAEGKTTYLVIGGWEKLLYPISDKTLLNDFGGEYSIYYILNNYNIFTKEDLVTGHCVGPSAAGGDATYNSSIGLSSYLHPTPTYVEGTVTGSLGGLLGVQHFFMGEVNKENKIAEHFRDHTTSGADAWISKDNCYIDFDAAFASLQAEASAIAGRANVTVTAESVASGTGGKHYKVEGGKVILEPGFIYEFENISAVSAIDLQRGGDLNGNAVITVKNGGTVNLPVTMIDGSSDRSQLQGGDSTGESGAGLGIAYVIPNASSVICPSGQAWIGHIVAPNAKITGLNGDANGSFIARAYENGGTECHMWPYNGTAFHPTERGFQVRKTVNGKEPGAKEVFYFKLEQIPDADGQYPEGAEQLSKYGITTENNGSNVVFPVISYDVAGTYYYRVTETGRAPVTEDSYVMDPTSYIIKVEVTSHSTAGETSLESAITYYKGASAADAVETNLIDEEQGIVFDNKGEDDLVIEIPGEKTVNGIAPGTDVNGNPIAFDFVWADVTEYTDANGYTAKDLYEKVEGRFHKQNLLDYVNGTLSPEKKQVVKNNAAGDISIQQTFEQTGTYYFALYEAPESGTAYHHEDVFYLYKIEILSLTDSKENSIGVIAAKGVSHGSGNQGTYHKETVTGKPRFENELKKAGLKLTKTGKDGTRLAGAEFDLYKIVGRQDLESNNERDDIKINGNKLITNAEGEIVVGDISEGAYYFVETKAPDGYATPTGDAAKTAQKTVTKEDMRKTAVFEYAMTNERSKGSLSVTKVDGDDHDKKLSGAEFTIYKTYSDGTLSDSLEEKLITNKDGYAKVEGIPTGVYYVKETKAPVGYEASDTVYTVTVIADQTVMVSGAAIGNNPEKTDIRVTKVWNDGSNQDGKRPNSIKVYLVVDGVKSEQYVELNESNDWSGSFTGLAEYRDGKKLSYTVKEEAVAGYTTAVSGTAEEGYVVTNTHTPTKTSIHVTKVWNDGSNQDGKRPNSVKVYLVVDGVKSEQYVELNESNHWSGSFTGLAEYRDGRKLSYTVKEEAVAGYTTAVSGTAEEGYVVTNTHTPTKTSIHVTKAWNDGSNQDGRRPNSVKVYLVVDGVKSEQYVELNESNDWSGSFTGLAEYRDGKKLSYTVKEEAVADYTTAVSGTAEEGYVVTNTHTPTKTSIHVTKAWNDGSNQDGKRPNSVKVYLVVDGVKSEQYVELNESNHWSGSFTGLAEYRDGKKLSYKVEEEAVAGYTTAVSGTAEKGYVVTNTHTPEKVSIRGSKIWKDQNNQDGKRPESITIRLLANGEEADSQIVKADEKGNWMWSFTNLDRYADGKEIVYTVTEDKVEEYEATISGDAEKGYVVTNTHTPEKVSIRGSKIWEDQNNQDGKRPESITIRLLANGEEADSQIVKADEKGNWMWSFTNLDRYANGKEIVYTVTEDAVEGYEATISGDAEKGYVVTNTHTPEKVSIRGSKIWKDQNNQDGKRPESITIRLLANGEEADSQIVKADEKGNWMWSFTNLDRYADGKEIVYTVTEDKVEEYEATISGDAEKGYVVTNTHTPEKVSIRGSKIWEDQNNQDGKRPESITIRLLANGEEADSQIVKADEKGNWMWSFTNLDRYANGKEIVYTVTEDEVEDYTATISGDAEKGYVVTNTHTPEKVSIRGSKIWEDQNNQDGKRPESITICLLANGEEADSQIVKADEKGNWMWSFTNLDRYANGKEIVYTVTEDAVEDYEATIIGDAEKGYVVTNTHNPEKVSIRGSKTWKDQDNQDGKRPESITIRLLANGEEADSQIVKADEKGNWMWSFTNLDRYANGKEIVYTVTEDAVEDYEATIIGDAEKGYVVTNTHTPEKLEISGEKIWKDQNNQDGKRPESITIRLLANGEEAARKIVKADEKGNWTWSFTNLDRYADGKEIVYTVTEDAVEDYEATIIGDAEKGYVVTNTHNPEKVSIRGSKTWKDQDNQDGKRPESITIRLLANGEEADSQIVKADEKGNWTWSFTNLDRYADGKEIVYTVTEDAVEGYTATISEDAEKGYVVTNTHTPEKLDISGEKIWKDQNNQDGKRPESITIRLLANGEEAARKIVKADEKGNWTWSFTNLDRYADGKEIVYTVTEDKVEEYEATIIGDAEKGYVVTNTHTPEKLEISGEKIWKDQNNQDGKRPESITIRLLANGEEAARKIVKADEKGNWMWSFTNLDRYADGKEIVYTVTEDKVEEYEATISGDAEKGYVVTNTHTPEKVSIRGSKIWEDQNNQDGKRPESITIRLLANGEEAASQIVKADEKGNWTWSFTNLDRYADGKEIVYTVTEDKVEEYTAEIIGDAEKGYVVMNTHTPEKLDISGEKIWKDQNNQDGKRPESITIRLLANGKEAAHKIVKADTEGNWTWSFTNLDRYANGKEIVYTVTEDKVEDYEATIIGDAEKGYVVTNTHTSEKLDISGEKIWKDQENRYGTRPESITIRLFADGKKIAWQAVQADENGNWSWTFEELPKYRDGGTEIQYTVAEDAVPGYAAEVKDHVNVENTLIVTAVSGTKSWNVPEGTAVPESITAILKQDGRELGRKEVTVADEWKYAWTDLPVYKADGTKYTYSVEEIVPENYYSAVEGYDLTNTIHGLTRVEGQKHWIDSEDQDGLRPESITVNLYATYVGADGKTYYAAGDNDTADDSTEETPLMSAVTNAEKEWRYRFDNLERYSADGKVKFHYFVKEAEVPEGYTAVEHQDGYDITNIHAASASLKLDGMKELNGNRMVPAEIGAEEFTFKVMEGTKLAATGVTEAGGHIVFDEILYTEAGTHTYVISENTLSDSSIEYSDQTFTVVVEVTVKENDPGALEAEVISCKDADGNEVSMKAISFTNDYHAKGVAALEASKRLSGNRAAEIADGEFRFEAVCAEDSRRSHTGAYRAEDGKVVFETMEFDENDIGKTYTFEITEVTGEDTTIQYSEERFYATVAVSDAGAGNLSAKVQYYKDAELAEELESIEFTNYYHAKGELVLDNIRKVLENAPLTEGQFQFVLKDADGNELQRKGNDAEGKVAFDALKYTEEDIHKEFVYTVSEVNRKADGITYDETVYTVKVTVEDGEAGDGTLKLMPVITKGASDGEEIETMTFTNRFSGSVTLNKTGENGERLAGAKFQLFAKESGETGSWALYTADAEDGVYTTDADGVITVGNLPANEYYFIETEAPYTYAVETEADGSSKQYPFTIGTENGADGASEGAKVNVTLDVVNRKEQATLAVTKKLTLNGEAIGAIDQTFYVALYEDEQCTKRVTDVMPIVFRQTSTSTVEFTGLEVGRTYYVGETQEDGTVILTGLTDAGALFEAVFPQGNRAEITKGGTTAFYFENQFRDLGPQFYEEGELTITKKLLGADGKAKNSKEIFYAGIFADPEYKTLSDQVSENIVALSMNGGSTATTRIGVALIPDEKQTLYITEVDQDGRPVAGTEGFAYDVTVDHEMVTLDEENRVASVTITNQESEVETEEVTEEIKEAESETKKIETRSVKTGDDTPIVRYAVLLAAAALALILGVVFGRRKKKGGRG